MMAVASILPLYGEVCLLTALAWIVLQGILWVDGRWLHLPARQLLWLGYALLVSVVVLPGVLGFMPRPSYFRPAAQVWAAVTMVRPEGGAPSPAVGLQLLSGQAFELPQAINKMAVALTWICVAVAAARLAFYIRALVKLKHFCSVQAVVRRCGRVRIAISQSISVPFSANFLKQAFVIVPDSYLSESGAFKIAVRHELQHHRQRDTSVLHGLELFKMIFFLNPFSHFFCRKISELQEFSCDEALVGHQGFSFAEYGRCLLWATQSAGGTRKPLVGTAGMAATSSGKILRKRLEMLSRSNGIKGRRIAVWATAAAATMSVAGGALAARGILQDQRITMVQAEAMADEIRVTSDFPIVVDELVLEQLNRYVGTPDGRTFMQRALVRMKEQRSMVESTLLQQNLPVELAAIPIVESAYANLPESDNPIGCCSGIWQFRRQTGRQYGLRIDDSVDDRRDARKATTAAVRLLEHNYDVFRDWGLAVSAYNMGEQAVQRAIDEGGVRDPWELARRGKLERYLSAVMAAVIVVKNPILVD